MEKKLVITIAREYGSGGRIIGRKVAEKLGIPFYDGQLIDMSAQKSGLAVSYIEKTEQKIKNKFFHNLAFGGYHTGADYGAAQLSLADKLFITTCEIIRDLAEQGSCVIVGRCADYVLKDRDDVINIFVYSDKQDKLNRMVNEYGVPAEKAEGMLAKEDKYRANHYSYYTERNWGDKKYYQLCVNSGFLGIDKAVNIIVDAIKDYLEEEK